METKELIDRLERDHILTQEEYTAIITNHTTQDMEYLFEKARKLREQYYQKDVYVRGLIEFSNYCKNDCFYCGIRCSNRNAQRYRLREDEILECANQGYELGFRTFVLQGGEDLSYSARQIGELVKKIKQAHPDCAITLSIGEREKEVYQYWYDCGAQRYLLRHETATKEHYQALAQLHKCLDRLAAHRSRHG